MRPTSFVQYLSVSDQYHLFGEDQPHVLEGEESDDSIHCARPTKAGFGLSDRSHSLELHVVEASPS